MASVQFAVLFLTLAMVVQMYNGISEQTKCIKQQRCLDLLIVERLAQHVSKDQPGVDRDNILLKSKIFDKIRQKKYLHSCVLEKIIAFYENALSTDQYIQNYYPDLISMLDRVRNCTYKVKRCEMLYQKANQQTDLKTAEADMSAQEVAIVQLQKLKHANERLNNTTILETAIDELKSLHHYIHGSAFRKTNG